MICFHGKTVFGGMTPGEAFVLLKAEKTTEVSSPAINAEQEWERLKKAVNTVKQGLTTLFEQEKNETVKEIYGIHCMMLEDEDLLSFFQNACLQKGETAQTAVNRAQRYFSQLFLDTQDDYMIARVDDIKDICGRLTGVLLKTEKADKPGKPVILVAKELLPGDLLEIGFENIRGIVMGSGTVFSHTSILIKAMGIPALICDNISGVKTGTRVLLNADSGNAYFEPDQKTEEAFFAAIASKNNDHSRSAFEAFRGKLYLNINDPSQIGEALPNKCDGIGLFRTEFLYIGKQKPPTEEEQLTVYKTLLQKANQKSVTVRTFDIGSDKTSEALSLPKEENPALGVRGLRVYSLYPNVFKTQLRALLRAAVYGDLRIMFPMVTSPKEILEIKQLINQTAKELEQANIPYKLPLIGAMIETPAAALLSESLAKTVDFFSIGTNDLSQYTLALDRQNDRLAPFYDESLSAVLALIKITAQNARKNGIETGICGELAALPELINTFNELGIHYLSVSPSVIGIFNE